MEESYHSVTPNGLVLRNLIANSVIVVIACATVALRLVARKISGAEWGWDDLLILIAVPQGLGMLGISSAFAAFGNGYNVTEVAINVPLLLRLLVAYVFLFATSTLTIKLSVLFFYLRVFVNRSMIRATKVVMVWVVLWSLGNILQIFLICRPFAASYDPSVSGTCGDQKASFIAIGSFNAVTDVVILCLPIPTIWALKATRRTKIFLTIMFTAGLLTTIVSICRIVALQSLDFQGNLTRTTVWPDLLSCLEVHLGILTVSMPMLGPVLKRVSGRKSTKGSSSGPSYSTPRMFGGSRPRMPGHYRLEDTSGYHLDDIQPAEHTWHSRHADTGHQTLVGAWGNTVQRSSDGSESELRPNTGAQGREGRQAQPQQSSQAINVERSWVISTDK